MFITHSSEGTWPWCLTMSWISFSIFPRRSSLTRYPSWPRDPSPCNKIVCPLQKQMSEWEHENHSTWSWKHCESSFSSFRPVPNGRSRVPKVYVFIFRKWWSTLLTCTLVVCVYFQSSKKRRGSRTWRWIDRVIFCIFLGLPPEMKIKQRSELLIKVKSTDSERLFLKQKIFSVYYNG